MDCSECVHGGVTGGGGIWWWWWVCMLDGVCVVGL